MLHQGLGRKAGLISLLVSLTCLLVAAGALAGYDPDPSADRASVPEQYQWNSSHIFPDNDAWRAELEAIGTDIPKLMEFKGRLGESAAILLDANNATHDMMIRLYKLYVYAQTLYDVDQGNNEHRQMQGQVSALFPSFGEATSWMEPELLEIDLSLIHI